MANMHDRNLVTADSIVDDVRIATEPERMYAEFWDDAMSDSSSPSSEIRLLMNALTSRAARGLRRLM